MEGTTGRALAKCLAPFCAAWLVGPGAVNADAAHEAVQQLDADHSAAVAAGHALVALGDRGTAALVEAWPSLSKKARRRAIAPLSKLTKNDSDALELVATAAIDGDPAIRSRALDALARLGPRGLDVLGSLVAIPETGDEAAVLLSRRFSARAVGPILAALGEPGGADRPALRSALRTAVQRGGLSARRSLDAWVRSKPSADAAASCALALTGQGSHAERIALLIEAADETSDFATTWRLLKSAPSASASEPLKEWLERVASSAEAWMLRAGAIEALSARGERANLERALSDPTPRVRVAAARGLSGVDGAVIPLAEAARRDRWHLVRAAALDGLAGQEQAVPIFLAAIDDPTSSVRAAAIDGLANDFAEVDAWSRIETRLEQESWPEVFAAAIRYAGQRCVKQAVPTLVKFISGALSSGASMYDVEHGALALQALGAIGGDKSQGLLIQVRDSESAPPSLKLTAKRALKSGGTCSAAD